MADEVEQGMDMPGAAVVEAPRTPGAKLRAAREAMGLSLPEIATRTRIAIRQLEAIERDDYAALPGIPYAIGFSRAYARNVGLNDVTIAAEVREAVSASDLGANRYEVFEPADPARVPSRGLAWTAVVIALIVAGGFALWRTQILAPTIGQAPATQEAPQVAAPAASGPNAPAAAQDVVFTAVEDVWLRIYDEEGERLKDGLLKKGETYTLPPNAANPMILTGRPQALSVTVGGRAMPPLGAPDRTIADVPVSAGALLARAGGAGAPATPAPTSTPTQGTPAPTQASPTRTTRPTTSDSGRPASRSTSTPAPEAETPTLPITRRPTVSEPASPAAPTSAAPASPAPAAPAPASGGDQGTP